MSLTLGSIRIICLKGIINKLSGSVLLFPLSMAETNCHPVSFSSIGSNRNPHFKSELPCKRFIDTTQLPGNLLNILSPTKITSPSIYYTILTKKAYNHSQHLNLVKYTGQGKVFITCPSVLTLEPVDTRRYHQNQ